jgi:Rab family protein
MVDRPPPLKLVLLGESGAGKTSLISRYTEDAFSGDSSPTVGGAGRGIKFDFDGQIVDLVLWDTAGQERYRGLAPMFYRNAVAAIIVFDLTNRDSFEQVPGWIHELQANVGNIVIAVCGNKIDCGEARVIPGADAKALADSSKTIYYETSAKTGQGVQQLFQAVVTRLLEGRPDLLQITEAAPIPVAEEKRSECC